MLERLKRSNVYGVPGVIRIDSGKPGPVLGITAVTHGNEPAGLAIAAYLLAEYRIEQKLLRGTLYLVANNIKAAERFFKARTQTQKENARKCDENMNRLPDDTLRQRNPNAYEVKRAQELRRIWKLFDCGLDVHSTLHSFQPMLIARGRELDFELVKNFPITALITNIDSVQVGLPAFSFYGDSSAKVFAIEAGQNDAQATFSRSVGCAIALMRNLHMLPPQYGAPRARVYRVYKITHSIRFPDRSYSFVKEFRPFHPVKEGELLASGDGTPICAHTSGVLVLPKSRKAKIKRIDEEMAFFSKPARLREVVKKKSDPS